MSTEYPSKRRTGGNTYNGNASAGNRSNGKSNAVTTYPQKRRANKKRQQMRRRRMMHRLLLVIAVCLLIGLMVYVWHRDMPSNPDIPPVETGQETEPLQTDASTGPGNTENPNLIRQYGTPANYNSVSDAIEIHIQYPDGEQQGLEDAIRRWIQQTVLHYDREVAGESLNKAAELNIQYESFRIGERYVSVHFKGMFRNPAKDQMQDVFKTFNVDCTTGEVLSLEGYTGVKPAWILPSAMKKAGITEQNPAIIENWTVAEDGIALMLSGEAYLLAPGEVKVIRFIDAELNQIKANPPIDTSHIDPNKPVLALTFDDGPSRHTERLLDIFAQHGGKATFYVVGNLIDERPDVLKRMVAEGHEVGGHSWSHKDLSELSTEGIKEQLVKTKEKICEVTSRDFSTMRPPWGNINDSVKAVAKESGLSLILWSIDTQDWLLQDADKVYDSVMSQATDGAIILMHDLHGTTVDAMERAIPDLLAQGYQLVTVPELLLFNGGTMEPGVSYRYR